MSELHEIQFDLKGGKIVGQEQKPKGIPGKNVLLLHGWQDNSNSYKALIPLLPQDWWLVAVDWPGHGLSSPRAPGSAYNINDWLVDVHQVIQKLDWKKFAIIGHSMGAGVALSYASLFPESVDAVVSLDVIKQVSEPPGSTHKVLRNAVATLADFNGKESQPETFSQEKAFNWYFEKNRQFMNEKSAKILLERGLREQAPGSYALSNDPRLIFPPLYRLSLEQHRDVLKELKCSLLIIKAGGAQSWESAEVEKEFLEMYSKNCSRFKHLKIDGLHHVHLDNPESVAPVITDFLNGQDISRQ